MESTEEDKTCINGNSTELSGRVSAHFYFIIMFSSYIFCTTIDYSLAPDSENISSQLVSLLVMSFHSQYSRQNFRKLRKN